MAAMEFKLDVEAPNGARQVFTVPTHNSIEEVKTDVFSNMPALRGATPSDFHFALRDNVRSHGRVLEFEFVTFPAADDGIRYSLATKNAAVQVKVVPIASKMSFSKPSPSASQFSLPAPASTGSDDLDAILSSLGTSNAIEDLELNDMMNDLMGDLGATYVEPQVAPTLLRVGSAKSISFTASGSIVTALAAPSPEQVLSAQLRAKLNFSPEGEWWAGLRESFSQFSLFAGKTVQNKTVYLERGHTAVPIDSVVWSVRALFQPMWDASTITAEHGRLVQRIVRTLIALVDRLKREFPELGAFAFANTRLRDVDRGLTETLPSIVVESPWLDETKSDTASSSQRSYVERAQSQTNLAATTRQLRTMSVAQISSRPLESDPIQRQPQNQTDLKHSVSFPSVKTLEVASAPSKPRYDDNNASDEEEVALGTIPGVAVDEMSPALTEIDGFTNGERMRVAKTSANGIAYPGLEEIVIDESPEDRVYFAELFVGFEHYNIVGIDEKKEPWVISIRRLRKDNERAKSMAFFSPDDIMSEGSAETSSTPMAASRTACLVSIRSKMGEVRDVVDIRKSLLNMKKVQALLQSLPSVMFFAPDFKPAAGGNEVSTDDYVRPQLSQFKFFTSSKKTEPICAQIMHYESKLHARHYKFGVLFCDNGQTDENDMFSNKSGDPEWEEFLEFMGEKIALKGWTKYRNGLDVTNGSTGEHSVYTTFRSFEIMFHVSTLLPYQELDMQRLERKRHFGNDIVVLIFKKGPQPYVPNTVKSEFNHIIFVVEPVRSSDPTKTFYRLSMTRKDGVPEFGPPLPRPAVFQKNHYFRELLLTKMINAERAGLHAPQFADKVQRTRSLLLQDITDFHLAPPAAKGAPKSRFSVVMSKPKGK